MNILRSFFQVVLIILIVTSCFQRSNTVETITEKTETTTEPEWTKNAIIYEVNIRQFTDEGSINAFTTHLPRLKDLGVDILWLMPIHPIGNLNRKGGLGSYYSVQDYKAVNPEFGTLEDLKNLVSKAHDLDMHVILDWVANHSAWDNPWATNHPEWYKKDSVGGFESPYDWTDVIALNYENTEMRIAMIDALKYWVSEADIDGYRCDVAKEVPTDFWEEARIELDKIKPVFMLAEAEEPEHLNEAFDMNYAWRLHFTVNEIITGQKPLIELYEYFKWDNETFANKGIRMNFIDNHDENSWKGTVNSRLGEAQKMAAAFMWTLPGMPLIYSGQEAGLDKSLAFFEKDLIDWKKETDLFDFYKSLNQIKKSNAALWNYPYGGEINIVSTPENKNVFAFSRSVENNFVLAIFNFTDKSTSWTLEDPNLFEEYTVLLNGKKLMIDNNSVIELKPYGYQLLGFN